MGKFKKNLIISAIYDYNSKGSEIVIVHLATTLMGV
jgi:hypothetical protein